MAILQYSCLENPMDRGAWWATVHEVAKSGTRLSNYCAHTHTYSLLNKSYSEGVQNKAILWLNVIIENLI